MKVRTPVPHSDKLHVAARQRWTCASCKSTLTEFFELDHVLPVALGGSNTTENLQALCPDCHRHKSLFDIRKIRKKAQGEPHFVQHFVPLTLSTPGVTTFPCTRCGLFITSETLHACRPSSTRAPEQLIAPNTAALLLHIDSLRYRERGK